MGYARYELEDGRMGGYAVEATCDEPDCNATIDRGMGYVCGDVRALVNSGDEGCGKYFCAEHLTYSPYTPAGSSQRCHPCYEVTMEAARCPDCSGEGTGAAEDDGCEKCDGEGFIEWKDD